VIDRGFLLIDKANGWTSHDVVAKARRITGIRKIGHAGTLDPMATGLVVLGIGRATKLLRFLQDLPKEYVAKALFGVATDSLDADGAEISRVAMPITRFDLDAVIPQFVGPIMQVPPMVSALKQGGRRLHELARQGVEVGRPPRPVVIHSMDLVDFVDGEHPEAVFRIRCGKGTYVRSLVDDMAQALGGRAHLTALRRIRNGSHSVEGAVTVDELERAGDDWANHVLTPADALVDLPAIELTESEVAAVSNGVRLARPDGTEEGAMYRMLSGGRLVAVYRVAPTELVSEVGLS